MAKSILKSISALMMSFLLVFTVFVLKKMLTTKENSFELAKTKKEQAKRRKKENLKKKLTVEPKTRRIRGKKKIEAKTAVDQLAVNSLTLEPEKLKIRRKNKRKSKNQPKATVH